MNDMMDNPLEQDSRTDSSKKQKPVFQRIKTWYRDLPDKKRYLEFVTALLTIPVLLTVIISNVRNLNNQSQQGAAPTPTPVSTTPPPRGDRPPGDQQDITPTPTATATPSPTPSSQCKKEIGPVQIAYPEEGATISKDPVCLDIVREGNDYCAIVWSYRINGGTWSEYTDKSICIYGLSPGAKKVDLRVKSIVTGAETILTRNFTITGSSTPTPTSTASAGM